MRLAISCGTARDQRTGIFLGVGRHGYIWNDDGNAPSDKRECGQEGCSSSPSDPFSGNNGPTAGDPERGYGDDPNHWSDGTHECSAIPGSDEFPESNRQIMEDCGNKINKLPWFGPSVWDCHTSARCFLKRYGMDLPPFRRWNHNPPFGTPKAVGGRIRSPSIGA